VIKLPPIYDNEKGMVLSIALLFLAVLTLIGSAAIVSTKTEVKIAGNWNAHTRTFYAAEAGLEKGIGDLMALLSSTSDPTPSQLAAISPPAFSDASLSVETLDVEMINTSQIVLGDGAYEGLRDYKITSEAKGPAGTRSRLVQMVEYMEIPLFQFGVFYGEGVNLEISPGPAMTFNGRVHSNSNLYLAGGGSPLRFDSFVTTAGNVHRYKKMDESNRGNNPQIKDAGGNYQTLNFDHDYSRDFLNPWSEAEWKSEALTTFDGKLLDSAMGVEPILPPVPSVLNNENDDDGITAAAHQMIEKGTVSDSDAMKKAKMYYQADLRIEDGVAKDKNGMPINMSSCDPIAITNKTFFDPRENATMTVTELNMVKLNECGKMPPNGILYVHKSGEHAGVRLVEGHELPSGGLTVVSENPMYIMGNYNSVDRQPAAVMGDAITILSNNWDDSKGGLPTTDRTVNDTTVNAAFALGPNRESVYNSIPDPENPNYNNGGLENAIRFLEDWSGKTFTYRGSIVSLWHTQQATGDHRCCGVGAGQYYNAPIRDWGYDTLFDTTQPPGTPKGVLGMTRVAWSEGQI
jgi:hypothetical protein